MGWGSGERGIEGMEERVRRLGECFGDLGEGGSVESSKGPKGFGFVRCEGTAVEGDGEEVSFDSWGCEGVGGSCLLEGFFLFTCSHLFSCSSTFSLFFF